MTNQKSKKIKMDGEKIYLKDLDEKNATQDYCDWLNDSEVNKYLETKEATIDELKHYIRDKNNDPNCLFLGIFLKENDKHVGNIKLEPIELEEKRATLGILIGNKEYWGQGIGTEATKLLVNYAFNSLDLKEVTLGVISENQAAIKVYKNAGFKVDRINKKSTRYGNNYYDGVVMSIKRKNQ